MTSETPSRFVQSALEHLGIEEIAPRLNGHSDYKYMKAVLVARGVAFVERPADERESWLVLYNGNPTIEMLASRVTSVYDIPTQRLPGYGLQALEFYDGVLQSY